MKVAIIGLDGHTGQILDGVAQLGGVQLTAVSDQSSRAMAEFTKKTAAAEVRPPPDEK